MSDAEISASDIYLQENVLFEKGKKYLIKANSGHGKTSILNFIYGNNTNFNGRISYNGVFRKDVFDLRKSNISYVFQDFKLFPSLTVFENIQLKNTLTNHKTVKEIEGLIEEVLLGHKKDSLVSKLSLGQKQRVAILRALCQPFEYLLLDEPFSHLDKKNIEIVTNIIVQEVDKQNSSLIMTSLEATDVLTFNKVLNL
jgi:putative ABC transport system ATP-binding protein